MMITKKIILCFLFSITTIIEAHDAMLKQLKPHSHLTVPLVPIAIGASCAVGAIGCYCIYHYIASRYTPSENTDQNSSLLPNPLPQPPAVSTTRNTMQTNSPQSVHIKIWVNKKNKKTFELTLSPIILNQFNSKHYVA